MKYSVALIALLVLVGCGGSRGLSVTDTAKTSLAFASSHSAPATKVSFTTDPPMTTQQAHCFANEIVDRVGVRNLEAAGVINQDGTVAAMPTQRFLTQDSAPFVAALFDCTNTSHLVGQFRRGLVTFAARTLHLDADCVRRGFTTSVMKRFITDQYGGNASGASTVANNVYRTCR